MFLMKGDTFRFSISNQTLAVLEYLVEYDLTLSDYKKIGSARASLHRELRNLHRFVLIENVGGRPSKFALTPNGELFLKIIREGLNCA